MTFGIIGYGRFGRLWASCLKPHGEVKIFDQAKKTGSMFNTLEEVLHTDVLFLFVPIGHFEILCKSIAKKVPPKTLIVDGCSVKVHPARVMQKVFSPKQSLVATHPLFGPDSVARLGLKGRKIVLCPLRAEKKKVGALKKLFRAMGLEIFETTPEDHDKQMARSQALVHFLGRGLTALKLTEQELYTPDYEALRRIDSIVNNDTWELFFDMQRYNPYTLQVRERLLKKTRDLNREIESPKTLSQARKRIETLDEELLEVLAERMALSKTIGVFKKEKGAPVLDKNREQNLQKTHRRLAKKNKLSTNFTDELFDCIFKHSRKLQ